MTTDKMMVVVTVLVVVIAVMVVIVVEAVVLVTELLVYSAVDGSVTVVSLRTESVEENNIGRVEYGIMVELTSCAVGVTILKLLDYRGQ